MRKFLNIMLSLMKDLLVTSNLKNSNSWLEARDLKNKQGGRSSWLVMRNLKNGMEGRKSWLETRGGFACCFLLSLTLSCQEPAPKLNPCMSGDCDAKMYLPGIKDENGYYHIKLNWNTDFMPYFFIEVLATEVIPQYRYNGISHVSAEFDTDTFWTLDGLVWREPLYNPFNSNVTSSGTWLPSEITELTIDFFKGMDINLVQSGEVFFHKKKELFYTKRSIGPIPPQLKGDTVTVYMEMFWDAGSASVLKDHYEEKFIIE